MHICRNNQCPVRGRKFANILNTSNKCIKKQSMPRQGTEIMDVIQSWWGNWKQSMPRQGTEIQKKDLLL